MGTKSRLRYPWWLQIICPGAGLVLILVVFKGFELPADTMIEIDLPIAALFAAALVILWFLPFLVFRQRRRRLHFTGAVCGRCENDLLEGNTVARYGDEYLCEECTAHMEDVQEHELPKFTKPD